MACNSNKEPAKVLDRQKKEEDPESGLNSL